MPALQRIQAVWRLAALTGALCILSAASARVHGGEIDLSQVNDDTPVTVGLYARVAEAVLPSVVSIRVYPQFTEEQKDELDKFRDFQDNPGDHLDDPEFQRFMRRFLDPSYQEFHDFFEDPEGAPSSSGAGVVLDAEGHIVTNRHIIGSPERRNDLEVRLYDGRKFRGDKVKILEESSLVDLAVLKIEADDLRPAHFGDSDKTRAGEPVLAIGHPLEFEHSVSEGIISARGRQIDKAALEDHFQTTAMINPGNSGGALVNMRGEVIGINVAIATNTRRWQGIGFAIPGNLVKEVVENLIRSGREGFGYLGVRMVLDPPNDQRAQYLRWNGMKKGVVVEFAVPGASAEKAGVLAEDIIVEVDGVEIEDNEDLVKHVAQRPVGDSVTLGILRRAEQGEREKLEIEVVLGERPSRKEILKFPNERLELFDKDPSDAEKRDLRLGIEFEAAENGLTVVRVHPGSTALQAGLRPSDVLTRINERPVRNEDDFDDALEQVGKRAEHLVHFEREGHPLWKLVPVK
jgi:serine protease Do